MIFGMKIHDLENMEHSEEGESEDDDVSSEDSFSSLGSEQDKGEVMFSGGLRYAKLYFLVYDLCLYLHLFLRVCLRVVGDETNTLRDAINSLFVKTDLPCCV